jgi:preprotein translocase subunit SecG
MYIFLSILIIIVCVLLTLVVLIQNPKGGGIASNFAAPNQIMGAKRSSDMVEKATWILAVILIVFSLSSNFMRPNASGDAETDLPQSRLKEQIENTSVPAAKPAPVQTQPAPTQPSTGAEPTGEPAKTGN